MKIILKIASILLISSLFFTNCTSSEEKKVEEGIEEKSNDIKARYGDEVMNVHDEIMPLTMKIPPLKEDLEAIKVENPDMTSSIDSTLADLQYAYDAMYQWMDNSGKVQSELYQLEGEAAEERLKKEREVILNVQKATDEAMAKGKQLKEELVN